MRYTYSRWDGTQTLPGVDPDELMDALSDDLLAEDSLPAALQRVTRWGFETDGEPRLQGLQDVLQKLRAQRREELERYNLDSVLRNLEERVGEAVQEEREGIDRRLQEDAPDHDIREAVQALADRKRAFLDALPDEPGSAVAALAEYEFLDVTARERFRALTSMLERHVLQRHFQSMERLLEGLTGDNLSEVKAMLHELNALLQGHLQGRSSDAREFLQRHGHHFPGARSVDELIDQMQEQSSHTEALMASMSPDMRRTLDGMMASILSDEVLREELAMVADALHVLAPPRTAPRDYPFSGEHTLSLGEALQLMRRMHDLDGLERAMQRAQNEGSMAEIDSEQVGRVLGDAAHHTVEQLKGMVDCLVAAGYAEYKDGVLDLTARGLRRIGQKALADIFGHLKHESFGEHPTRRAGGTGDRSDDTKPYEWGDPFTLDLHGTLMNAVERTGPASCIRIDPSDFEVFGTEELTQASTVLMLDMSRSMPLRGCFTAARKVALALSTLIRLQFPRDHLYVIGFSDYARQIRPERLHRISWGDYVYGTNMQHGLILARRLLGRHHGGSKQVILITDGEPTAHIEGGRVHFAYPPTFRTFQETLREVKRCTQEGIVINTFMLERSHFLTDFVTQMTRINRGRAFFATPERLGDYVVVDYVKNRERVDQRV